MQRLVGVYDKGKAAIVRLENVATYVDSGKPCVDDSFRRIHPLTRVAAAPPVTRRPTRRRCRTPRLTTRRRT